MGQGLCSRCRSSRRCRRISVSDSEVVSLPSLDELDDIAVWVLDHGDAGAWPNLGLGDGELHAFLLEHGTQATEIMDHERQVADAELLLQTDCTRRWHLLGIH